MNVRDNEISKVSYLFPQKEDKRDICYLENSNGTVIFIFSLNKEIEINLIKLGSRKIIAQALQKWQ